MSDALAFVFDVSQLIMPKIPGLPFMKKKNTRKIKNDFREMILFVDGINVIILI